MSVKKLHEFLDEDGDGNVDRREFMTRMMKQRIEGINERNLGNIFDALDINGDGKISPEEFQLYIKGANKNREQRLKEIDPDIVRSMRDEIQELFSIFDINKDGLVDASEIMRSLQGFNIFKTEDECRKMIQDVEGGRSDSLDKKGFEKLMLPFM